MFFERADDAQTATQLGRCPIRRSLRKALRLLLVSLGSLQASAMAQAPDWILVNANIYTMDARRPKAQALAVRGERLAAVGSNEEVRATAGPGTRVVDAAGQTVTPGFIDAHGHMLGLGQSLKTKAWST